VDITLATKRQNFTEILSLSEYIAKFFFWGGVGYLVGYGRFSPDVFSGIFPTPVIPPDIPLDIFLEQITNPGCNERRYVCDVTLFICYRISCRPNSRKKIREFSGIAAWRNLQGQITKALAAAMAKQFTKIASDCRSCYNCIAHLSGQLCLLLPLLSCKRV